MPEGRQLYRQRIRGSLLGIDALSKPGVDIHEVFRYLLKLCDCQIYH